MAIDEQALLPLANAMEGAANSLFLAMKYTYVISEEDYYNVSVKDVFKVALSDVSETDRLSLLGIRLGREALGEMESAEFLKVKTLIYYSFAIRLPYLRKAHAAAVASAPVSPDASKNPNPLKDSEVKWLYDEAVRRGANNFSEIIDGDYHNMLKNAKRGKLEPEFNGEWFRRWVYTCARELSVINNRNLFLFGCVDAMFPLYYAALTEKYIQILNAGKPV